MTMTGQGRWHNEGDRSHFHEVTVAVADRAEVVAADVSGQGLLFISSVWNAALTLSLLRSVSKAREDVK